MGIANRTRESASFLQATRRAAIPSKLLGEQPLPFAVIRDAAYTRSASERMRHIRPSKCKALRFATSTTGIAYSNSCKQLEEQPLPFAVIRDAAYTRSASERMRHIRPSKCKALRFATSPTGIDKSNSCKQLEELPLPLPLPLLHRTATIPTTLEVMIRCQNERCRLQPITKHGEVTIRTSP